VTSIRFDRSAYPAYCGRCGPYATARLADNPNRGVAAHSGAFLSVVIPARNEAQSLPQLLEETVHAVQSLCSDRWSPPRKSLRGFEVIVVDDGSTDRTHQTLKELTAIYPELRSIRLWPSGGQSVAIVAGLRVARGNWIATLDADLQNDPADLVMLWDALTLDAHEAALGWRIRRRDNWRKRLVSRIANWARNLVLRQTIRDTGCSLRIFPRELALRLPLFQGVHRFFGPLLMREGCCIVQVPVTHRARPHGRSHYNLWNRSLGVLTDLLGVVWLLRRPVLYEVITGTEASCTHAPEVRFGNRRGMAAASPKKSQPDERGEST
jgi:glycosyltransferase involved in cell wall biosynthesis